MALKNRRNGDFVKVAVVGSGMAGLVAAWALNGDKHARYQVELFESGAEPSLDSASLSVVNQQTHEIERIDIPMRAFTEGYYQNLKALYDYLGVRYCVQPFIFTFSKMLPWKPPQHSPQGHIQYFVHASNSHRFPPLKPPTSSWAAFMLDFSCALLGYLWFTFCCFAINPRPGLEKQPCETLDQYLKRIKLPQSFVRLHLLPLLSAVTTCSHRALLDFPAKDIVDYKRKITFGRQMTVANGINEVQTRLIRGINIQYLTHVEAIVPVASGLKLCWKSSKNDGGIGTGEKVFDKVILAVPPNVAGNIFEPIREEMKQIPTVTVETSVHFNPSAALTSIKDSGKGFQTKDYLLRNYSGTAHVINLKTSDDISCGTEATHILPSGAMVTTCPLSPITSNVLASRSFTRVLRTPESRRLLEGIFNTSTNASPSWKWKNGDEGVWLVGGWCWDGMVLLEGCVVSAMRVANALGVEMPLLDEGIYSQLS